LSLFSRKQYYHLGDGRFSVRQLVDENGDLALTRSYDPFGLVLQETGSGEALFGFMGAQAGGMGLLYVGGCYYDPRTGRFLSPNHDNFDPKRPGTLNSYRNPDCSSVTFSNKATRKRFI
jgi:RHS repeat-associated protein